MREKEKNMAEEKEEERRMLSSELYRSVFRPTHFEETLCRYIFFRSSYRMNI